MNMSSHNEAKLWGCIVDRATVAKAITTVKLTSYFLDNLKSQHNDIKFTMEIEFNNYLSFLEVAFIQIPNGHLGHSVLHLPIQIITSCPIHRYPTRNQSAVDSLVREIFARVSKVCLETLIVQDPNFADD